MRTLKDLETWFHAFVEFTERTDFSRICPMATIAGGLEPDQVETRECIAAIFAGASGKLEALFQHMRAGGELPEDTDCTALADTCLIVMQGGLLVSRIRKDSRPFRNAIAQVLAHIRSLRTYPTAS
ncbi:MAG: TetR family transcriptional regulator C-terminal domain-containing protein [Planctomycetota bacterium]